MDLSVLNAPQREAVRTTEGPLLVLAGAGSGKTRVITHRIGYLMQHKMVSPRAILAVTFTNKAATEMRARAVQLAGPKAKQVTLCTFHAFGADVMREHATKLGYPKKFSIADMGDQYSIIKRAMREHNVDDRAFDARKVLTILSRHKNARTVPQPKPEGQGDDYDLVAHLVFPIYQLALKAQGAVDFDDLLLLPSVLFSKHPEVLKQYLDRYRYLMVDEYQDTNAAQLDLLVHLQGPARNVCVVGDDDQCIYSWRGAEVRNILDFDKRFPGAKEVRLEENYRSTGVILDAANAVIAKNPDRKDKRMWTQKKGGPLIQSVNAPDELEEARFVAHEIHKATVMGTPTGEIAILYRTNGQSRPLEEALREKQLPYEVVGGQEFFDKREVKDVIAYFKAIVNEKDESALLRIVNVPARGIGDVTLDVLSSASRASGQPLWETFKNAESVEGLPRGAAEKVAEFVSLMDRYRASFSHGNLGQVTRQLLKEIAFADAARATTSSPTAADRKIRAVDELIASLDSFEQRSASRGKLMEYLHRLSLDTREEEEEYQRGTAITLMTLHAAKGLEWKLVFLVGMEEDLLPHSGMQGEPPNPEEERRLAYVGITRARERLVLTRAAARAKRGKLVPRTPSRFLEDLPEMLVDELDLAGPAEGPPTGEEKKFFAGLKEKFKAPEWVAPVKGAYVPSTEAPRSASATSAQVTGVAPGVDGESPPWDEPADASVAPVSTLATPEAAVSYAPRIAFAGTAPTAPAASSASSASTASTAPKISFATTAPNPSPEVSSIAAALRVAVAATTPRSQASTPSATPTASTDTPGGPIAPRIAFGAPKPPETAPKSAFARPPSAPASPATPETSAAADAQAPAAPRIKLRFGPPVDE